MRWPLWIMRLFRLPRPVLTEDQVTPFLQFWPGEIVRHMGRPLPNYDGFEPGCVMDAGRDFVVFQWYSDCAHPERITDPAALQQIIKQPRPAFAQL